MNPNYIRYTDEILPQLNKIDLDSFKTKEDKLAFWINIYNALVLHSVINFKITKSVKEKGYSGMTRFFSEAAYTIGGYRFSLEEIEHGILRANRGNP